MLRKILYTVALVSILVILSYRLADEPIPEGSEGPRAEFLTERMLSVLNYNAWKEIDAIAWTYPTGHEYIWDKNANLVEVKWDDYRVILNTETRDGHVFIDGEETNKKKELLEKAFENFANDSFWLIAPFKAQDPGTIRKAVKFEGKDALLVQYTSGGVTPGDTYLWILDENGVPTAWKFWVKIIPVGGLKFTWEGWETIEGAKISTFHDGLLDIKITNLQTASKAEALNSGIDPFELLR